MASFGGKGQLRKLGISGKSRKNNIEHVFLCYCKRGESIYSNELHGAMGRHDRLRKVQKREQRSGSKKAETSKREGKEKGLQFRSGMLGLGKTIRPPRELASGRSRLHLNPPGLSIFTALIFIECAI